MSFWLCTYHQPLRSQTVSVWVGGALLVYNCASYAFPANVLFLLELSRPLSEVICVIGVLTSVILHREAELTLSYSFVNVASHLAVGATALGGPFTWVGILVALGVLSAALLVYWARNTWPYNLAPVDMLFTIPVMLCLRLVGP